MTEKGISTMIHEEDKGCEHIVDYKNLPAAHLKSEETKKQILTRIYQMNVIHKKFTDALNVVIIEKKNVKTGKIATVILFSTDLELEQEIFKILPENTKPINIVQLFEKIPVLGRIHGEKKAA
ncbi:MAG: hypothetical protein PHG14_05020 [Desulfobacter postgatei]|uniref:hypothetical protein n=1 Tax=Desulfobacter postgatei TaxID=2293 RepID=UPI0023EFA235|nr:hypothetical protein [Desulfobacter postgatei]MDD4273073.1 hypothetical protein [Desulfobacter postgatei]